ncbi:MAG: helix-turn-helix domain-containing protein [Sphingomonas sp.]|nr:helix-turn-helix domain-containing protein [Sphingomonas sp.]
MSAPEAGNPVAEPISVRVPEAVRLTGLSRSRLYELMKSGDIEFVKVGSSTLILVESLRGFIHDRRSSGSRATFANL